MNHAGNFDFDVVMHGTAVRTGKSKAYRGESSRQCGLNINVTVYLMLPNFVVAANDLQSRVV